VTTGKLIGGEGRSAERNGKALNILSHA